MTQLVAIGNSKGVRIPAQLIKLAHLDEGSLEFEVTHKGLLIKVSKGHPRAGWAEACKKASLHGRE